LAQYVSNFTQWITNEANMMPVDSEVQDINWCLNDHFLEIQRRVKIETSKLESADDVAASLKTHSEAGLHYLLGLPLFTDASDELDAAILVEREIDIDKKIDYFFKELPGLEEVREILRTSAPLALSRAQEMKGDTDLGFIGFGSDEYFATSQIAHCRGRYGNLARVVVEESFGQTADESSGSIKAFAQSDAIFGFIRGAQSAVKVAVYEYLWETLTDGKDENEEKLKEVQTLIDGLRNHVDEYQTETFVNPMLDTIGSLSLRDVADLAVSLVGMQATRSAASPTPASVGGFIESLVIDRNDGVRWVNRLPR